MAAKTFDEVYLVNYSSYDDVNLYEVGCQKCDPSYGYGPIIRKLYILHYVVSGEGICALTITNLQLKNTISSLYRLILHLTMKQTKTIHGTTSGFNLTDLKSKKC